MARETLTPLEHVLGSTVQRNPPTTTHRRGGCCSSSRASAVRWSALNAVSYHSTVLGVTLWRNRRSSRNCLKSVVEAKGSLCETRSDADRGFIGHPSPPSVFAFRIFKPLSSSGLSAPCRTRTCDLLVRRAMQALGLGVLRAGSSDENLLISDVRRRIVHRLFSARGSIPAVLGCHNADPTGLSGARFSPNHNLDILVERRRRSAARITATIVWPPKRMM